MARISRGEHQGVDRDIAHACARWFEAALTMPAGSWLYQGSTRCIDHVHFQRPPPVWSIDGAENKTLVSKFCLHMLGADALICMRLLLASHVVDES